MQEEEKKISVQLQILDLFRMIHSRGFQQVLDYGIHPGQVPLVVYLSLHDGCRPVEIGKALQTKPSTVSVSLRRLEKSGFVELRPDLMDQRSIRVYNTEKLRRIKSQIWRLMVENERTAVHGFTEQEKEELSCYLTRMQNNLRTAIPGESGCPRKEEK